MALVNEKKKCKVCGKIFSPKKGVSKRQWNKSFWCSHKCHSISSIGRKLTDEQKKKISISNEGRICSKETKQKISESNKGKIRTIEMKEKQRVSHLGKVAWNKGKKFPQISGKKHPQWKGGVSKGYKFGYYSLEYKNWRKAVFERDNFLCQNCGKDGYITAHHIKSFAHYPELRFELSNGITLCEECHKKTDNYKGRAKYKIM